MLVTVCGYAQELKTFQEVYRKNSEEIRQGYQPKFTGLQQQYQQSLETLKAQVQGQGDLAKTKAAVAEIARFQKVKSLPAEADAGEIPEIKALQTAYVKQYTAWEADLTAQLGTLAAKYEQALALLQKELVKAGKLDEATAVQAERVKEQSAVKDFIEQLAARKGSQETSVPGAEPSKSVTIGRSADGTKAKERQAACAKSLNLPVEVVNSIGMRLTLIPEGHFLMGSPDGEKNRRKDESQHEVTISKPFYMGIYLVTVDQFAQFVKDSGYKTDAEKDGESEGAEIIDGKFISKKIRGASWRNPSIDQKGDHPVVQVSWNDANAFCDWLSKKSGETVSLPTEAQWEYACRAGTVTAWFWGDNPSDGKGWANCADQSLKTRIPNNGNAVRFFDWDDGFAFTSPVGSFKANKFGLFDMIGNAAHWCLDRYGVYEAGAATDPKGPDMGASYVVRGGSWNNFNPTYCRSAARYKFTRDYRNERYGFRIVVALANTDR